MLYEVITLPQPLPCGVRIIQPKPNTAEHRVDVGKEARLPDVEEFCAQALNGFQRRLRLTLGHLHPRQQPDYRELNVRRITSYNVCYTKLLRKL